MVCILVRVVFLPPATKLGQGYVFTTVCDSVHGGGYLTWSGGCAWSGGVYLVRYPPQNQVHPLDQVHSPGPGTPPRDQVHPPGTRYPPGPGTPDQVHPPQDQVHPQGPSAPPWDQVHPLNQVHSLPGPSTPIPPMQSMLGDTVNARAVRILLECNLVLFCSYI